MGNKGRIFKDLSKSRARPRMALADTRVQINGCQVLVGSPDPIRAQRVAEGFRPMLTTALARARVPNLSDYYNAHFEMCKRIKSGESIEEIID